MTVSVVDGLQVIHVDDDDADRILAAALQLRQFLVEISAVIQASQGVMGAGIEND